MSTNTLTSANSKFTITVAGPLGVVVGPFTLQGYATDDAFATEMVDVAQALMGVDGNLSAGYTPFPVKQTIVLQADSPSIPLFDAWLGAMKVLRETLRADGVLAIPGQGKSYAMVKGYLTRVTPIAQAKAILQPVTYEITWQSADPAPIVV